jgi:TetR/AcrR family transcriptional regulator, mexJK operon transcriptional repressor
MATATQQTSIAEIESTRVRPVTRLDGNAKSRAILDAAARLFLVQGFGATSMRAVAAAAGISKRTLYIHFRTKHALFVAVIQTLCARIASPPLGELGASKVEDGLESLGCQVLSGLCSAEQIELFRTVVTDVRRFPELGVVLLDGPMRCIEDLFAEYFRAQVEARKLVLESPCRAAAQFLGLLKADLHVTLLMKPGSAVTAEAIRESVKAAVTLFLNGARRDCHCPL